MHIVVTEGMGALKMPRLAQDAAIAVGGLYRYFERKQDLVAAMQGRAVRTFGAFLAERLRGGPLERVVQAADAWAAFADRHPVLFQLLDRGLSDPSPVLADAHARAVDDAIRDAIEPLVRALAEAADQGLLAPGDAEVRAYAVWAAVHGARHFQKRDRILPERLHGAAIRREVVATLLRGWAATA